MSDKRDFDEKDKLQPSHRQDRTRMEDRDRNIRDGTQNRSRQMPPRFLKQQAERNQSGMGSNSVSWCYYVFKYMFLLSVFYKILLFF